MSGSKSWKEPSQKAYQKHLPGTLHDYLQKFENAYVELAYVVHVLGGLCTASQ